VLKFKEKVLKREITDNQLHRGGCKIKKAEGSLLLKAVTVVVCIISIFVNTGFGEAAAINDLEKVVIVATGIVTGVEPQSFGAGLANSKVREQPKVKRSIAGSGDSLMLVNKKNNISSDYVPKNLVTPKVAYAGRLKDIQMREEAASALEKLFAQAQKEGIKIFAISGYRSYEYQKTIFTSNAARYGETKANSFSARPGQSEHQTGLAMDVSCAAEKYQLEETFGKTLEGKWLIDNAIKYGFIIRYPEGKEESTGYIYEPWHIRYVGEAPAKYISANNLTLEEYVLGIE
jgi:LAS superfamily LD-carboxypeptidase LdcB